MTTTTSTTTKTPQTPPLSRSSSQSSSSSTKKRRSPPMSLDLSDLPPLTQPASPTNTLIITNVNDPALFTAPSLQQIQTLLSSHTSAWGGIHTFAPLRSFRRIIVSFFSTEAAIAIRSALDGEAILSDERIRVYFGEPTPLNPADQHLGLPAAGKLFFISPPPSPPHGWMIRNEEPPNKDVHADDLAAALAKLHRPGEEDRMEGVEATTSVRPRSGSRSIVFESAEAGVPAIAVEDMTEEGEGQGVGGEIRAHTARPPVELMQDS